LRSLFLALCILFNIGTTTKSQENYESNSIQKVVRIKKELIIKRSLLLEKIVACLWYSLPLSCVNEAKRCVQTEYKEEDKKSRESTENPIMQFRKKERKKERKTEKKII
jgi:hypothetical protein